MHSGRMQRLFVLLWVTSSDRANLGLMSVLPLKTPSQASALCWRFGISIFQWFCVCPPFHSDVVGAQWPLRHAGTQATEATCTQPDRLGSAWCLLMAFHHIRIW